MAGSLELESVRERQVDGALVGAGVGCGSQGAHSTTDVGNPEAPWRVGNTGIHGHRARFDPKVEIRDVNELGIDADDVADLVDDACRDGEVRSGWGVNDTVTEVDGACRIDVTEDSDGVVERHGEIGGVNGRLFTGAQEEAAPPPVGDDGVADRDDTVAEVGKDPDLGMKRDETDLISRVASLT